MNLVVVALLAIIFAMLYTLYMYLKNVSLTKGVIVINQKKEIEAEKLNIMANDIYYDGWLFLMNAGSSPGPNNILIKREFSLMFSIINQKPTMSIYKRDGTTLVVTITEDFPLQKWVFFAIRYKGGILETYLNGKLINTISIKKSNLIVGDSKNDKLEYGNIGLSGYLTKLRRLVNPPDANKIWETYLEGNSQLSGMFGTLLNYISDYDAKITISKDNKVQRETKLF